MTRVSENEVVVASVFDTLFENVTGENTNGAQCFLTVITCTCILKVPLYLFILFPFFSLTRTRTHTHIHRYTTRRLWGRLWYLM